MGGRGEVGVGDGVEGWRGDLVGLGGQEVLMVDV